MSKELYPIRAREMSDHRSHESKPPSSAPGKFYADLDFEIKFFEALVAESPDYLDALIPLAESYTQRGHYQKGLETDIKICQLRPNDPVCHYNLACSLSLLGRLTESLAGLEQSLALGYDDLKHLEHDTDLTNLKKDPRLHAILQRHFPPRAGKSTNSL